MTIRRKEEEVARIPRWQLLGEMKLFHLKKKKYLEFNVQVERGEGKKQ